MDKPVVRSSSLHTCPLCGPVQLRWRFEKKGRQFWRCNRCGMEMQRPLPTPAELRAYYDSHYTDGMYKAFTDASDMKAMTACQRLREIAHHVPLSGHWLDVGSADGTFVGEALRRGIEAEGIELSAVAAQQAQAAGLPVRQGMLEDISCASRFDCITAFDVLEHVLDPGEFLRGMSGRLHTGGHAVLTLPNVSSVYRRLMGARWWFYIPDEHLHYFNPATIRSMLARAGLEVIEVSRTYKPLTFDYGLTQFIEYNPMIYRVMTLIGHILPARLRTWIIPLYIGEMKVVARKSSNPAMAKSAVAQGSFEHTKATSQGRTTQRS